MTTISNDNGPEKYDSEKYDSENNDPEKDGFSEAVDTFFQENPGNGKMSWRRGSHHRSPGTSREHFKIGKGLCPVFSGKISGPVGVNINYSLKRDALDGRKKPDMVLAQVTGTDHTGRN